MKVWFYFFFLSGALAGIGPSWALPEPRDIQLYKLMHARSLQQVEDIAQLTDQVLTAQSACQVELKSTAVPVSCFEVLRWEKSEKILAPAQADKTGRWLAELCTNRASNLRLNAKIQMLSRNMALPYSCRQVLLGRLREFEYIEVEVAPENVFGRRHVQTFSPIRSKRLFQN